MLHLGLRGYRSAVTTAVVAKLGKVCFVLLRELCLEVAPVAGEVMSEFPDLLWGAGRRAEKRHEKHYQL